MFANRTIGGVKVPCVALYVVVIIVIFAYGAVMRRSKAADFLERPVIDSPSWTNFDGWALTHFLFWGLLGFLYPGNYVQALVASLAWEGFEDLLGRNQLTVGGSRLQLVGEPDADASPTGDWNEGLERGEPSFSDPRSQDDKQFWYGRYTTDTFFNLSGYILGTAAADRWWPNAGD